MFTFSVTALHKVRLRNTCRTVICTCMSVISHPRRYSFVRDTIITAIIVLRTRQLIVFLLRVGTSLANWEGKVIQLLRIHRNCTNEQLHGLHCADREEKINKLLLFSASCGFYQYTSKKIKENQENWTAGAIKIRTTHFSVRKWMLCLVLDLRDNSINV
jgi:hypothetical protein